jgi:hypothetical protein
MLCARIQHRLQSCRAPESCATPEILPFVYQVYITVPRTARCASRRTFRFAGAGMSQTRGPVPRIGSNPWNTAPGNLDRAIDPGCAQRYGLIAACLPARPNAFIGSR